MKIDKPWGYEELLEHNPMYVLKRLFMKSGHACSLQYHKQKQETVYILSGKIIFEVGSSTNSISIIELLPGMSYTIKPTIIHRMSAAEDSYYLEASTSQLDDVVRLSDRYGRI
jgi:mannose-6-phosphate isomerase-like protein (cupin superfamily)